MSDAEDRAAPSPRACPDAGCGGLLDDGGYCSRCGEPPTAAEKAADPWGERRLCPDGSCTGVLDEQGRCPECGGGPGVASPEGEVAAEVAAPVDEADLWAGRRLCPDGSCIGVLDPSGRCPRCGRSDGAEPAAAVTT